MASHYCILQLPKIFVTQPIHCTPSVKIPFGFKLCRNVSKNTNRGWSNWHLILTKSLSYLVRNEFVQKKLSGIVLVIMMYNTWGFRKYWQDLWLSYWSPLLVKKDHGVLSLKRLMLYKDVYWARDLFPLLWKFVLKSFLRRIVKVPWVVFQALLLISLPSMKIPVYDSENNSGKSSSFVKTTRNSGIQRSIVLEIAWLFLKR